MMDVSRAHAGHRLAQGVQEHDRVRAAGEPDENGLALQLRKDAAHGRDDVSAPWLP